MPPPGITKISLSFLKNIGIIPDMKSIETINAVGHMLCHDLTRIVPGEMKDAQFRKGHIVTEEDIPILLSMGKDSLFVWERDEHSLHEDEAAERLADLCQGNHMTRSKPKEGKIELFADCDGLFQVDIPRLNALNDTDEVMVATRHTNTPVRKGDKLAGTRIIPLVIDRRKIELLEQRTGKEPLLQLHPYRKNLRAGIVTTGNEVYYDRIEDRFTPVVSGKLASFGIETAAHEITDDQTEHILEAIRKVRSKGIDLICCTGGMSVDPDDRTPAAIRSSGASVVTYGVPVLPGAMFLLAYYNDGVLIVGLPGCVMYARTSVFDLVLPRLAAGIRILRSDLTRLGNGGLCLQCIECTYPNCGFGKE